MANETVPPEKRRIVAALLIIFILCALLVLLIPYYEKIGNFIITILTPKTKRDENDPDEHRDL
jgi:hypothetical protein